MAATKLTETQIAALHIIAAADPSMSHALRPTGHRVVAATGRTWDKLKDLGFTEMGTIPGFAGERTVLSQAGRDFLASLP